MLPDYKILVIDDDEDVLIAASILLKKRFGHIKTLKDPTAAYNQLRTDKYDAVLLDMNFTADTTSGHEGFLYLRNILNIVPDMPVILITAYGNIEMAVRGVKEGAFDFILKPWKNEKLLQAVESAIQLRKLRKEKSNGKTRTATATEAIEFIGESEGMKQVFTTIKKVAPTDANVLISGDNGTGKELVARELHRLSARAHAPFVSVDMGSISESLFESELFGHSKGAFTDAREERKGRLESAQGGTLFLDEISNLSLPMQSKLLNTLQDRKIYRVGSSTAVDLDVRLVCASNVNLNTLVKEGKFRQDLLFRINTVELHLPSLRYRGHDIYLLADYFLKYFSKKYNREMAPLNAEVKHTLRQYTWPGNVRELQHRMERAVILSESSELKPDDLQIPEAEAPFLTDEAASLRITELERGAITRVLKKHGGNITHAAKELGLSRAALYRRIEKYDL